MSLPTSQDDDPSDEDTSRLVRGTSAGDVARFNALYERLAPSLYTWAELRMSPKLRGWLEPADLVQEVWFRTLRSVDSFDPAQTSFRYWVFRVAKNALLEALRKSDARAVDGWNLSASANSNGLDQIPDSVTGVSRRMSRSEELQSLGRWIEALQEDERELVIHIGLEGMSHAQVGERLGLETKTVTKRWQRLRERIEAQGSLSGLLA